MSSFKRFHSHFLFQRMFIAFLCWMKRHKVAFVVLITLLSFSFYVQTTGKTHATAGFKTEMQSWDTFSGNSNQQREGMKHNSTHFKPLRTLQNQNRNEGVDMVYTWVNGSDPVFIKQFEKLMNATKKRKSDTVALNRYGDWGILKYSMRSVELYAPWIRHIYLLTNGQVPYWLDLDNPRISIVTHEEIFSNKSDLPAFTSPAIECHIHKIKGLSKKFIYMNDDIILTSKLLFEDFYTETEGFKLRFFHERIEHCNKLCPANNVNNGKCEKNCTSESCEFDGDDCSSTARPAYPGPDKTFMFDSWGGSLMHTHFLFNKAFGPQDRYIPEHTAHLFDKDILAQLMEVFPDEWKRTSSTKVRHHLTIQPEFAFYNYLKTLEQVGEAGVKTKSIWAQKDNEKIDFILDNRGQKERTYQLQLCKREILLKRPKFLVFSDHFNEALFDKEREEIQISLTDFLTNLLSKPSQFEIT